MSEPSLNSLAYTYEDNQDDYRYLRLGASTDDDGVLTAVLHYNSLRKEDTDYDLWQKEEWARLCEENFFSVLQLQIQNGGPADENFTCKLAEVGIAVLIENFVTSLEIEPGQLTAKGMKAFCKEVVKLGYQMRIKSDGHLDRPVLYEIVSKASKQSVLTLQFHWAKEEISKLEDLTIALQMGITNPKIIISDIRALISEINNVDISYLHKYLLNNQKWSEWYITLDLVKLILAMVRVLSHHKIPDFMTKKRRCYIYLPMLDHVEDKNITLAINNRLLPSIKSLSIHWAVDVQLYTIVENEINATVMGQAKKLGFKDLGVK